MECRFRREESHELGWERRLKWKQIRGRRTETFRIPLYTDKHMHVDQLLISWRSAHQ